MDLLNVLRPPSTHSLWLGYTGSMRMIDEDEVGLKEKPEGTSKRLHRNETRSTGSMGKGLDSQRFKYWELHTREWAVTSWRVLGGGEIHTQGHHLPRDC